MHQFILSCFLITCSVSAAQSQDVFTPAKEVASGIDPDITIDYQRNTTHLIYYRDNNIFYRKGDLEGNFKKEQVAMPDVAMGWDAQVEVDGDGNPHIVCGDIGTKGAGKIWYSNNIGGSWKPKLLVLEKNTLIEGDTIQRTGMPNLAVDSKGTVFIAVWTNVPKGVILKLKDVDTKPAVDMKRKVNVWAQVAIQDNRLLVAGRHKSRKGENKAYYGMFAWLETYDPDNLTLIDSAVSFHDRTPSSPGETVKIAVGKSGNVYLAGTNNAHDQPTGWMNTLERAKNGLKQYTFNATFYHAHNAVVPLEDRSNPDLVYLVYWSGAELTKEIEKTEAIYANRQHCVPGHQLRYAVLEQGQLIKESQAVTNRTAPHMNPYRSTPAAAALPGGGIAIMFQECGDEPKIFYTMIKSAKR